MNNPNYPPPSSGKYVSNTIYPPPPPPGYPSAPPQPPYTNAGYPSPPTYVGVNQYHDYSGGPVTGYSYPPPSPQHPGYQGYFAPQNYPPPSPQPPPYQVYHCEHECYDDHDGCSSFLRGCLAALCFCCILDECCGC